MRDWFSLSGPSFRATIEASRLTLVPIRHVSLGARAVREALCNRTHHPRITVVDLSVDAKPGWQELVAHPLTGLERSAEQVLLEWATATGYRRAWLPDRMVELADGPPEIRTAIVTCPVCKSSWSERGEDFWAGVLTRGCFPSRCGACGGLLPQWQVEPAAPGFADVTIERRWIKGDREG